MRFGQAGAGVLFFVVSVAVYGCGGSDAGKDPCLVDCENQRTVCGGSADAGGVSCEEFCSGVQANNPAQCRDKIDAFFQCAVDKETYSCPNGVVMVSPVGGCAAEGASCAQCTGKALCYLSL